MFGAVGTDDVFLVGDEAFAYETGATVGAEEAIVVPVSVLEGDELGAADSCDRLAAGETAFGEKFSKTFRAVGLVVAAGEAGPGQACLAMRAGEAFPVPRLVLVRHAATSNDLIKTETFY